MVQPPFRLLVPANDGNWTRARMVLWSGRLVLGGEGPDGDERGGAERFGAAGHGVHVDPGDRDGATGAQDLAPGDELVAARLGQELDGVVHGGADAADG